LVFLFLFVIIQTRKRNYVFDKIVNFFKQLFGFSGNTEIITSDFHNLGAGNFLIGKWIILFFLLVFVIISFTYIKNKFN
jgi:hypothetical protein